VTDLARFILEREGKGIDQMKARGELDWKLRQATGVAKAQVRRRVRQHAAGVR
jgi:hypothetical protein